MIESVITSCVTYLLRYIRQQVTEQANLIQGAEVQVQSLHTELQLINAFFLNFEENREEDTVVNVLVRQIQDVALDAKKVIGTFVTENAEHMRRDNMGRAMHGAEHLNMLRTVAIKVKTIKDRIDDIMRLKERYGIDLNNIATGGDEEEAKRLEKRRREVEENDVVGFTEAAKKVIDKLIEDEPRREVISIVGMGGSGKTTLAKKIYGDREIEKHFKCRAWVFVPEKYSTRDLMLGILKNLNSITEEASRIDIEKLAEMLTECLKDTRYLIVMDGVWTTEMWEDMVKLLPDNKCRSRILLTTRENEVAVQARSATYKPPILDEKESWELLSRIVFQDEPCPIPMVNLGKQIAKKCNGLPLSLVFMGSFLAKIEINYRKWSDILTNVNWYLTWEASQCLDILALSYYNLPRHLKNCFLFLGVFPQGFEIPARRLINLWVAEGFINQVPDRKVEDIAETYLEKLIDRNLIQAARFRTDGGVKSCRVHDLLRSFCIAQGSRERFLEVQMNYDSSYTSNPQRLSIHYKASWYFSSKPINSSSMCCLMCFDNEGSLNTKDWKLLSKGFKSLKVLDLGFTDVDKIPNDINQLILLRYLRINPLSLKSLPSAICNLVNLQTLDIRKPYMEWLANGIWEMLLNLFVCCESLPNLDTSKTCMKCLPSGIWRMKQLRHLLLPPTTSLPSGSDQILPNLQTLSAIAPDGNTPNLISDGKFPNLTKLTLYSQDKLMTEKCLESLHRLEHLQNLKIIKPVDFPCTCVLPVSLTKVTLVNTDMVSSKVKMLENLPRLEILKLLSRCIKGDELIFEAGTFLQLRVFHMVEIDINTWVLKSGAMPCLEDLVISHCHKVDALPDQLWHVLTLRQVTVKSPSQNLRTHIDQLGPKKRSKIQILQ